MVIFPDIETILVSYLSDVLDPSVYIATKKPAPDAEQPAQQVIVIGAYNQEVNHVMKLASVTLDVYAEGDIEASTLALQVESLIRGCTVDGIKRATVRVGPVRTSEPSDMERRSIDVELVVLGSEN